jgi:hypothetical protein
MPCLIFTLSHLSLSHLSFVSSEPRLICPVSHLYLVSSVLYLICPFSQLPACLTLSVPCLTCPLPILFFANLSLVSSDFVSSDLVSSIHCLICPLSRENRAGSCLICFLSRLTLSHLPHISYVPCLACPCLLVGFS